MSYLIAKRFPWLTIYLIDHFPSLLFRVGYFPEGATPSWFCFPPGSTATTPISQPKLKLKTAVKRNCNTESITLGRLEAALAIIARAIVLDGPVYGPYLERLEREIAAFRASDDTVFRAHRYLRAEADKLDAQAKSAKIDEDRLDAEARKTMTPDQIKEADAAKAKAEADEKIAADKAAADEKAMAAKAKAA